MRNLFTRLFLFTRKGLSANLGSVLRNSASLLVVLCLSVGNVWGDVAKISFKNSNMVTLYGATKITSSPTIVGNVEVSWDSFTFDYKNVTSTSTKDSCIQINSSVSNAYNTKYVQFSSANEITKVELQAAIPGSTSAANEVICGWTGTPSDTPDTIVIISIPGKGTTTLTTIDFPEAKGIKYVRCYRCPKIKNGKFDSGGTNTGSSTTWAIAYAQVTTAAPACPSGLTISGTQAYTEGQTINLSAALEAGNGTITYTWYKGTDLATAKSAGSIGTGTSFSKSPCTTDDAGNYWCEATKTDCSAASNASAYVVTVVDVCAGLTAPAAFANTDVTGTSATFSITDDANATSYDLYYSTSSTAPTAVTDATTNVTTKTPTVTGLTPVATYYAWVRAVCDASHKSNWVALTGSTFTTGKATPNSYIVGASAEGECEGGMTAKITLSGSQVGVDYQLKNNGVNDGAAVAGTGNALEWSGKSSGVYTVWAVENASYSGLQMSKTATIQVYVTTAITTQPQTTVDEEVNESFTLGSGMVAAGNALTYRWYTCGSTGADTVFISGAIDATYTTSQSVANTYYYRVRVEGTCGEPVLSNVITVTITSVLPPSDVPTISVQPSGDTYCYGDEIDALSVTATGSGTLSYQWKKDGIDIPSAISSTYTPTESGTYVCVVTNTEDGKYPTSLASSDAVVTIHAAVATPTITQTENFIEFATATAGATIYYTTDGTDPSTSSASGTSYTLTADCTIKAYAVKDGCASSITTHVATFDSRECVVLISYTLTSSGTATSTLAADEDNLVGGSADYKVSSGDANGGYKLGAEGNYFGLTLASGQFKVGDKVTVTITQKNGLDDRGLHLCTSKTESAKWSIVEGDVVVGENVFTLDEDCDAIYVARSSSCVQNPYVKSISVCRKLNKYTVTFDKNDASATGTMSDQSFYDGFASKLKANTFALAGYEFDGWATSPSGSKVYDNKQSITLTGNITLYALWKLKTFTLTNLASPAGYGTVDIASVDNIPPGTGTSISNNTSTVNGTTVSATPADATAQYRYEFSSWSGLPATVTADATVTAVFNQYPQEYDIILHTNGGTINSGNVEHYFYGTGATLPTDVTKSGNYEFGGWYNNSTCSGSPVTTIPDNVTGNMEYWAKWILCPETNSGETVYKFVTKSSGLGTGSVCATASTYYDMTTANALSELVGGYLLAYASSNTNRLKYAESAFTFANGDGGLLQIELDCPIASGDILRYINSATGSSYHAYVRHTSSSTSTDQVTLESKHPTITTIEIPAAFVGEQTLYLVRGGSNGALISYFEIIRSCSITLDAGTNGGTVGGNSTQVIRAVKNDVVSLPHAFKDGYRFKGWFAAPSGGSAISDPYTVTGGTTLYAQFEDCPHDGTMYKFEVGTGLTDGAVTANNVAFEFTTSNYLTTMIGGTLTTDGEKASKVLIVNTDAISMTDNGAYLKVDMDCALAEGDVFKSTIDSKTVYVSKTNSRASTAVLPVGILTETSVPASLVGEKTLYLWKGSGSDNAISYFEITRPKRTNITLSAPNAYNHYTTSVVATYDQPMPEIATLPLRTGGYVFGGYYDAPNGAGTQYYNGLGYSVRDWDKDVVSATLYAYWVEPCNIAPTLTTIVPVATIWDGQKVDMSLVQLSCEFDTTGIHYSLVSASEAISGCTFTYMDERIYIQGTPTLGNASTVEKTITFTMTNDCSPASTYTVTATIRIYPVGKKAKIAYIIEGTEGGGFYDYTTSQESSSSTLLSYLRGFYTVDCVNGYATKDATAIANFYKDYDLLIVTDFMETPKGYTNAIGTLIDKKPILSFEAYVAGKNGSNWHIGSNPADPSPKAKKMKVLCAGHAIFKDAEGVQVINKPGGVSDTTITVLSTTSGKGLQGFVINEAPDFIFLATVRDESNSRDLIVSCERQIVFQARLLMYCINYNEMNNLTSAGRVVMHQMIDYLLSTDETKVADCSLVFDNGVGNTTFNPGSYSGTGTKGDGKWSTAANWAPGYNIIPTAYHPTRIIAECHVDVDNAHAGSVKVNQGRDEYSNPVDGKLIIEPYGGLTIAGIVAKVNDTRYASPITIKAEDLLIKADATHNGAFVYGNKESDVRATVEYYSRGTGANSANPVWQYIGIPFRASQTAIEMYYEAWMCRWEKESGLGGLWQWVDNNDVLIPFEGYCITQESTKTYTNAGKLNPPITTTIALDNQDDDGFAFAANSWTAPIKIQEMADEDFTNAEAAIYIYHTGSYANWESNGDPVSAVSPGSAATLPGQYAVIPIHSSPYLTGADSVIPAMQGFFVKTTSANAQLDLVYNRTVYDAKYFRASTQPMRAPRRVNTEPDVMVLGVSGATSGGDRVHLLSRSDFSDSYADGWDGRKIEGDSVAPMLAIMKETDKMSVAAIPTMDERNLLFRAGRDSLYVFTFNYNRDGLYLYDRLTEQATPIQTDKTYSFKATNKIPAERFLITSNPPHNISTDIDATSAEYMNNQPIKIIHEDKLLILYRGEVYDALGKRVRINKLGE